MALADAGVHALLIIRPVTNERGDRAVYLIEQGVDLRAVIHVVGGQRGRHDLAGVGIPAEVQFPQDWRALAPCFSTSHSPGPQSLRPVLSTKRCTGSALWPQGKRMKV